MPTRDPREMGFILKRRTFLQKLLQGLCYGGIGSILWPSYSRCQEKETFPRRAMFYQKGDGQMVHCQLCFRRCAIPEGKRGFCRVRENRGGDLFSLVYGRPAGLQIDPIELEPMYHMVPAHKNLCIYTASCNFRCKHCHNWMISQSAPEEIRALSYRPKEIVAEALKQGCQSISHSINEPTVFYEMMVEVAEEAKKKGLLTLCHTNGGIARGPLRELLKWMDGITVDLKAFQGKFYEEVSAAKIEPVLETLRTIREAHRHLEIVNLIIPTLNDHLEDIRKMARWIVENLGREIPLHFTRFSPSYKTTHLPPTPIKTLEDARAIALAEGLRYVYVGNVVGHPGNSTYCPKCGKILIQRSHFIVLQNLIPKGLCPFCQEKIPGIWKPPL